METQPLSRVAAREIIRSLSNGVVPKHGCWLFSHGREQWLKALCDDMDDAASEDASMPIIRLVNGRNGDGKTHLMHLLRHYAFMHGLAVSYVVISEAVPLHRWDRVYQEIARSLTTPSGRTGLGDILNPKRPAPEIADGFEEKALTVRDVRGLDPDFATAVYRYTTQQPVHTDRDQDMHVLRSWLEGYATGSMRDFAMNSLVDRFNGAAILRSLVRVLRHFGIPGVLIMVDEVESVLSLRRPDREKSYQTLRLLIDGSNLSEHSFVVASTTPPMYTDRERGLQTYPALWSRIRPDEHASDINYFGSIVDLTKATLSADDFIGIARSISDIYATAFNVDISWDAIRPYIDAAAEIAASNALTMTFSAPRVYVKVVADMLDAARLSKDLDIMYSNMRRAFGAADRALSKIDSEAFET